MKPMQASVQFILVAALLLAGAGADSSGAEVRGTHAIGAWPAGGVFTSNVPVVITSSFPVVRFTLDGSEVTTNAPVYPGTVVISNSCLLLARGFSSNGVAGEMVAGIFSMLETNFPEFKSTLPLVVIDTFGRFITSGTNIGAAA